MMGIIDKKKSYLIWITGILSQTEIEGLYHWVNSHLLELGLAEMLSFSEIETHYFNQPKESLKLVFPITSLNGEIPLLQFRELIWSELFSKSYPGISPYGVAYLNEEALQTPKELACFDMDSTLIDEEVIDELARLKGVYSEVSKITENAMQGKMDFIESLKARVKCFKSLSKLEALNIIPLLHYSPGAKKLIETLRSKGLRTAILSGGFSFILSHFQKELEVDHTFSNHLIFDDELNFTGEVEEPIIDALAKKEKVAQMKSSLSLNEHQVLIVGDGANDIPMMTESSTQVSFCGKPKLNSYVNILIFDRHLEWLLTLGLKYKKYVSKI